VEIENGSVEMESHRDWKGDELDYHDIAVYFDGAMNPLN
jgi:hypothetical protein